jgi:hypothetical protein
MGPKSYTDNFFSFHLQNSVSSAEEVIPVVMRYVQPASVIDIGCGIGTWLKVWKSKGVKDIAGVDGSYVKMDELLIDKTEFTPFDLATGYSKSRKYDLVSSLEVAEHIRPDAAGIFVESLCKLGDVILFSAAIPGQEGTLHINEQYPGYWVKQFAKQGFVPVDCIRQQIWENEKIAWWYRQNIMFFVKKDVLNNYPALMNEVNDQKVLPLVHPLLLNYKDGRIEYYEKVLGNPLRVSNYLARAAYRKIKKLFKK